MRAQQVGSQPMTAFSELLFCLMMCGFSLDPNAPDKNLPKIDQKEVTHCSDFVQFSLALNGIRFCSAHYHGLSSSLKE